jgi:hypothetical protein
MLALASLRVLPAFVVRLSGLDAGDRSASAPPDRALAQGRRLLAALIGGVAFVLAVAGAALAGSGTWDGLGLAGAIVLASALGARQFRFAAEVLPLAACTLLVLTALEVTLVRPLLVDRAGVALVAPILLASAMLLVGLGLVVRSHEISPGIEKRLDQIEGLAITATVPLALGVWGFFDQASRLIHHIL